jgi:predicted HicB family RNase H-like nuclease
MTIRSPHAIESGKTSSPVKFQQILGTARQLYECEPDWVTFFREILGVNGIVRRHFTRLEDLTAFEKSPEFEQIQKWLVRLREQKNATETESEPTRVITVRLPKSMHEYLRTEAHDLRTTMNKLCISKLLQVIEQDLVPTERSRCPPSLRRLESDWHHAEQRERAELRRQLAELQAKLSEYDRCLAPKIAK